MLKFFTYYTDCIMLILMCLSMVVYNLNSQPGTQPHLLVMRWGATATSHEGGTQILSPPHIGLVPILHLDMVKQWFTETLLNISTLAQSLSRTGDWAQVAYAIAQHANVNTMTVKGRWLN